MTLHLFFASVYGVHIAELLEGETTMTAMFVNLPVTDLERAKAFYTAIGFTVNPQFTDHNASCIVVEEDHNYFMLVTRDFFQTFTDLPLGDPKKNPTVATAIFLDTRDAVDAATAAGLGAGGTEAQPASDYGFMYQRQLTDPDGNILEFGWMDPAAAKQGPEAYAAAYGHEIVHWERDLDETGLLEGGVDLQELTTISERARASNAGRCGRGSPIAWRTRRPDIPAASGSNG